MEEINRLHCSVTGAYAYRARVDYKNPGQSSWTRSDNLANVSVGISRDVDLKDVSGIKEGAAVRFVMDIRLGKTVVASEVFTYKKGSNYYASYNGTGTTLINPKAVYKGRFSYGSSSSDNSSQTEPSQPKVEETKGEINRLHCSVTGAYAYRARVDYKNPGQSSWKRSDNLANVSAGIDKDVDLKDVSGIKEGAAVRFVMDIMAGKTVVASEVFTYKKGSNYYASYNGTGTTLINPKAVYKGRFSYTMNTDDPGKTEPSQPKKEEIEGEINRLHCSVTGAYAYRAKVDYKNPGQSDWTRSDNLANVSVGISKDVNLWDVSGIKEGATVRFVMDIRAGKTVVASEVFTYKKESYWCASYNGTGTTLINPKAVYKGKKSYAPPENKGDIFRLHLTVTGAYAYRAKVEYMNPGQEWARSDNLANVSVGISKEVCLKDVSGIKDGAIVRFVMDIRAGKTVIASECFTYKKDSVYCASYNGTGTTLINPKAVYKGRYSTEVYSGEASALFLKVTGAYAYNAKVQYRKNSGAAWKTTGHVVNVTAGLPEIVNISEVGGINSGDQFRFVMDIVAGSKDVVANEYFVYKNDATSIANYDCKGTTQDSTINFNGIKTYTPVDFVYDGKKTRNSSIYSAKEDGLPVGGCVRIKGYSLADVMKFVNNGRIASIIAEKNGAKNRITTYASGPKNEGRGHIWFMDKNFKSYEEDVILYGDLSKEQTTDYSSKNPNIIYISWNDKFIGEGSKWLNSVTLNGQYPDVFKAFGFESKVEDGRRFYNTMVECFQRKFGYCDLYDEVFDFGTTMLREKFEFTSQKQRYILWAWKGHYLNLGAGAELGLYKFKEKVSYSKLKKMIVNGIKDFCKSLSEYDLPELPFTETVALYFIDQALKSIRKKAYYDFYEAVDNTLTMPMTLTLKGKGRLPKLIRKFAPPEKQWWITTFVPGLQGVNPQDLTAEFSVQFDKAHERMFADFTKAHSDSWNCDSKKRIIKLSF